METNNFNYTIKEIARLVGKSENLIYRRLTEKNSKYIVRFARREGDRWVFHRDSVDKAIQSGESIITKKIIDKPSLKHYLYSGNIPCGKELANG